MKTTPRTLSLAASFVTSAALAVSGAAVAHDSHAKYSAGEPGDPKKPSREIVVDMSEMRYSPAAIDVKRGEQIKFIVRNSGAIDHEFLLATTAENLKHAEAMRKNPDMEHDEPNGVKLGPGKSGEVLWRFSKRGTFEYSCLIPDHRQSGMIGKVVVK